MKIKNNEENVALRIPVLKEGDVLNIYAQGIKVNEKKEAVLTMLKVKVLNLSLNNLNIPEYTFQLLIEIENEK